ncbi:MULTISPECIES: hypothetical protein [Listeria]|uniref:hypothetical protein n=1 Tax=Listeria TaxID=1637 RepID=UPI000B598188|nr:MULTISPECIES: hypothetical protein [Listeria]
MAKSKAKKQREKLVREGRLNPEIKRSPFHTLDLSTRKTKTKKDALYQNKYKNHSLGDEKNGFYFAIKLLFLCIWKGEGRYSFSLKM